jgi:hypothetical protein
MFWRRAEAPVPTGNQTGYFGRPSRSLANIRLRSLDSYKYAVRKVYAYKHVRF